MITDNDVIQLNVGGQLLMTTRYTLTRISNSILSIMFNGQWEEKLNRDNQGNIFLDFNPILFQHLLEQLRLINNNNKSILISSPSLSFEKMLRKLNINQYKTSLNIIQINIGGELITTQKKKINQITNLTKNLFIDSNPKLFRQLIYQFKENENEIFDNTTTTTTVLIDYNDGICKNAIWNPNGITIAGGNGQGSGLNQLNYPMGLYIDKNSSIYIADTYNHRIMKWLPGSSYGEIILYSNYSKNFISSLVKNSNNGTIYYCNRYNNRIEKFYNNNIDIILTNISCWGLKLDNEGYLYISDQENHRIIKYPTNEILTDNDDHQLSTPYQIFIDLNKTIYIADYFNHRIIKSFENYQKSIIVAGGNGYGNELNQLKLPHAIIVDYMDTMYIVDFGNDRILRWFKNTEKGFIIIGNGGTGNKINQLSYPYDIAFDKQGNLYVADTSNHRIQMYMIDKSACENN